MRKVIYSMMVSLDGFIARSNGDLDWVLVDEELHKYINDQESAFDTHLYGRGMYEVMAAYWPTADKNPSAPDFEREYSRIWQRMQKIVFSTTLQQAEGNSRLIRGNIPEEIARLKAQPGKDMGLGGANLAATFIRLGLVDEYQLYVQPVVLGSGKAMFPSLDKPIDLRLLETHPFNSGVVMLHYGSEGNGGS